MIGKRTLQNRKDFQRLPYESVKASIGKNLS